MSGAEQMRPVDHAEFRIEGEARPSSRSSTEGAGWQCTRAGVWRGRWDKALKEVGTTAEQARLTWKSLHTLLAARHEKFALPPKLPLLNRRPWSDSTHGQRAAWVAVRKQEERLIDRTAAPPEAKVVFVLLGDTGEGDASQYAVVEPLLTEGGEAQFTVIASDVVYPAGAANDYILKFYAAYSDVPGPIYAVPGNHDWDDGELAGFMFHVCGIDDVPSGAVGSFEIRTLRRLRLLTKPPPHSPASLTRRAAWRQNTQRDSGQVTPYWALDVGPLRIVGIDTGVGGPIDNEQGVWLREVSQGERPKILVTGKPLYVDNDYKPGEIDWDDRHDKTTIDDIVRAPEHHYLATIGGDIHNYQRYPVVVQAGDPDGRPRLIQYIVSGGGGAFTSGTHKIPSVDAENLDGLPRVQENDFRCYPRRGDSLSYYCAVYKTAVERMSESDRLLAKAIGIALDQTSRKLIAEGGLDLDPKLAEAVMAKYLGIDTVRPGESFTAEQLERGEQVRDRISRLPHGRLGSAYYPFWDRDDPPFFKSFLRVEADGAGVLIRCFAATGCGEHEQAPPLEDVCRWDAVRGWSHRYAGLGGSDGDGTDAGQMRGRAEVYRRSEGSHELVVSVVDSVALPEQATVRVSPSEDLADAAAVGSLTLAADRRSEPLPVGSKQKFGSVEIVDAAGARFASGRFW
jgi:Calcineurin-like phosphoesterase